MTVPDTQQKPESMFQKEQRKLGETLKRLGNCFLNKTFDLSLKGSQRRQQAMTVLFIGAGVIFTLSYHPIDQWTAALRNIFQYLFNPEFMRANPQTPIDFFRFAFGAMLAPKTLRYLPLFILPYLIALQAAATYLADIFEIKPADIVEVAREFIRQVAFTGAHKSITIRNGEIAEQDKKSPVYLIGGPGQVVVELDSAALFEKPTGQPHIIGPTVKGKVKLEGFERLRQAFDLRDQYTDPLDIKTRSIDGIPISTTDVRMVYSVWRDGKESSTETPHPFDEKAIATLVYSQTARVIVDGPYPSELPSSWTGAMQGPIRGKLGAFMSTHRLAEYLASIGTPEIERARQLEEEIVKVGKEVVAEDDTLEPRNVPPQPEFKARHIFSQFAEDFNKTSSSKGVQVAWIGVGTWKAPNEIVTGKHLEAWRLSRENITRGNQGALNSLRSEAELQQTLRLIQDVPLARFRQSTGKEHKNIMQDLLIGYREQLIETIVLLKKSDKSVPDSINAAIKHIEKVLKIKHWVRGADSSPGEDAGEVTSSDEDPSDPPPGPSKGVPSTPDEYDE